MAWVVLVISGILETVWAVALDRSAGFSRLVPSAVFVVALILSMAGLAWALREIPVGTGYAVWVGIGAVGTALVGMIALGEPVTFPRVVCLFLVIAGVVGLKLSH
ncbi:ligand-binding protein SH3 [Carbonactinospora thermoautotrophica]|uniref:Ligand-binding protein SH3 n=1 Tax=Carbonactinospora thermoautotrophica TaxID=1469144 RepID=A0A132MIY2_9ACTN|nr:SMR family transporter [Carbonactinospora thermoautotrophica]KWW97807.1 ligand-binding protein SH3 [Carbonactinospora thermoautotrophica]KWW98471.1 Small multidrug resistance protein [Carbonactinospora thermoautotrophica]KWX09968.1 ligand-binding protein SH3 [Carbonactinospora thermoautotrophica]MCX9192088.1 ligand-binding protein SH3 [Carbonactinospora thermoautotrophica]